MRWSVTLTWLLPFDASSRFANDTGPGPIVRLTYDGTANASEVLPHDGVESNTTLSNVSLASAWVCAWD
ncbi:hypothetical protein [Burkholderia gladioli]|uniref:hypothetical protein n=1 Tax=Burkholderia gladioli TaxID=28095 RepID=UPI001640F301|nr:hypothetical protein [Burkholderia gladioli]